MPTYFECEFANGKAVVRADGKHVELTFVDRAGLVHQLHCEATGARLDQLLMARDDEDFDPDGLQGWEPGAEHMRVQFEE